MIVYKAADVYRSSWRTSACSPSSGTPGAVVGKPSDNTDGIRVRVVVLRPAPRGLADEGIAHMAEQSLHIKRFARSSVLADLPTTPTGKVSGDVCSRGEHHHRSERRSTPAATMGQVSTYGVRRQDSPRCISV